MYIDPDCNIIIIILFHWALHALSSLILKDFVNDDLWRRKDNVVYAAGWVIY